jgi:hypothetical protein
MNFYKLVEGCPKNDLSPNFMKAKLLFTLKVICIALGFLCIFSVALWGGNWIIAKEYLNPPDSSLLGGLLITGMWSGLLLGKNWKWRGIGIFIGLVATYLYMYIAVFINHIRFSS